MILRRMIAWASLALLFVLFASLPAQAAGPGSLVFDGKGFVGCGDILNTSEGTIEFWFKPATTANNVWALSKSLDAKNRMELGFGPSALMYMVMRDGEWSYVCVDKPKVSTGLWQHVACTFAADRSIIYVNGRKQSDDRGGKYGLEHLKGGEFKIGQGAATERPERFSGALAQVRLSDVLRYDGDFVPSAAPFATDEHTVALWDFAEDKGDAVKDSGSGKHDGKIVGEVKRRAENPFMQAATPAGKAGPEPFPCVRVKDAPAIDGKLDDPCWAEAAAATGFLDVGDPSGSTLAARQTTVRLAYDDKALYLSAVCIEPDMTKLAAVATERDGEVFNDDCLEFLLAFSKGAKEYFHYAFNALGAYYDGTGYDRKWDSNIATASQRLADRWTLEVAIPFGELKAKPPAEGDVWSFNAAREHQKTGGVSLSSWALLSEPSFHKTGDFALLRFAGEKLEPGAREFSNRKPTLENPLFAKRTPDGKPAHWSLSADTACRETAYMSGAFEVTTSADDLMARQELGWRQAAGQEYNVTVMALGDGDAALGVNLLYETTAGKSQVLSVLQDEPVTKALTAYTRIVTIPQDARRVAAVELRRSNRKGTLSIREVQFTEASVFSGVKEAKRRYAEHCWPLGEPFPAQGGVQWGTPLSGGPISTLLIIRESYARQAVELDRRFDTKSDIVWIDTYSGNPSSWGEADRINGRLSRSGKPYDVIILAASVKSQAFRNIIRENVNQGAGLVLVHDVNDKDIREGFETMLPQSAPVEQQTPVLRGVPWRLLPAAKEGKPALASVGSGAFGKGRVVTLGYNVRMTGLLPYGYALDTDSAGAGDWWEYVYSLVGRGILECANRDMPARIESAAPDADGTNLNITVAAAAPFQGALTISWTDKFHLADSPEAKTAVKVAAGERVTLTCPIPESVRHANGNHVAGIILRDDQGKTADWSAALLPVAGTIRIGEAHPFARDWYPEGQPVQGAVRIENRSAAQAKLSVTLELLDASERCVWRETKAVAPAAGATLEIVAAPQLDRVLTAFHRIRATVSDERGALDGREWTLRFPDQWKYDPGEFHFGVEGSFNHYSHTDGEFASYLIGAGATFGGDGGLFGQSPGAELPWAAFNIGGVPLHSQGSGPNMEKCVNNPEVLREIAEGAAAQYVQARRNGVVFGSVADELELVKDGSTERCFCPFCEAGFRRWAQRRYGNLDRLNAEWGVSFKAWEEVKPIKAEEARKRGNYAQWVDFRNFMEESFTNVCAAIQQRIKQDDPGALLGLTDPFIINPFSGLDNVKMARVETAMVKYMRQDIIKECISLNRRAPAFTHFGYGEGTESCRWYPWWFAMNGGQFLVWWGTACNVAPCQLIDSIGRQTPRSVAMFDTVRDLNAGVGKIFRSFPPARNPVAVVCSQASMQTAWAESGMRVGEGPWGSDAMYQWVETAPLHSLKLQHRSQENFKALLKETSLQPDFIPDDELAVKGRLSDYRIVMLPYAAALSEDALAALDDFARSGGTVLADLRTAAYSDHGKPLPGRASFEALFGLRRKAPGLDAVASPVSFSGAFGAAAGGKGYDQPAGRESLELTTGQAMAKHADGTPAFIVNARGKGRAIYLNFVPGNGPASTAVMAGALELAGVKRQVALTVGDAPAIGYECFLFERGPVRFLGLMRDMLPQPDDGRLEGWNGHQFRHAIPGKEKVSVRLPGECHVYDVRAGKYLGRSGEIAAEMDPAEAKVFGLLPYKVTGVALNGLKASYRPGDDVQCRAVVSVSDGAPGDHVLRIETLAPDGKPVALYTRNVLAIGGQSALRLPLALNDRRGSWTVKVTDVATGTTASAGFGVVE